MKENDEKNELTQEMKDELKQKSEKYMEYLFEDLNFRELVEHWDTLIKTYGSESPKLFPNAKERLEEIQELCDEFAKRHETTAKVHFHTLNSVAYVSLERRFFNFFEEDLKWLKQIESKLEGVQLLATEDGKVEVAFLPLIMTRNFPPEKRHAPRFLRIRVGNRADKNMMRFLETMRFSNRKKAISHGSISRIVLDCLNFLRFNKRLPRGRFRRHSKEEAFRRSECR